MSTVTNSSTDEAIVKPAAQASACSVAQASARDASYWPPYIGKGRQRFPRAWMHWTEEEDALLTDLYKRMMSIEAISERLGRGPRGIQLRLQRLNLLSAKSAVQKTAPVRPRFLPVPQMDYVPAEVKIATDERWVAETAEMWGVKPLALQFALQSLDQLHWLVFVLLYGLAGRCAYSLTAVAHLLGRSHVKVSEIQHEAENTVREGLAYYGCQPFKVTLNETLARTYGRAQHHPIPGQRLKRA